MKTIGAPAAETAVQCKFREGLGRGEELCGMLLASLTDHVAILDQHGKIMVTNDSWEKFGLRNGVASVECIGPGTDYLEVSRQAAGAGDELARQALAGLQSVLNKAKEAFELEYPCDSPSETRWFVMKALPLKGPKGGAIVSHTDITRRKEAEETALKRSRILTAAERLAGMGSWEWDFQSNKAFWSDEMYRLAGFTPGDLTITNEDFKATVHPEDLPGLLQEIERALQENSSFYYEYRSFLGPGRTEDVLEMHGEVIPDTTGKPANMIGVVHDITERKRAEQEIRSTLKELREREEQFRQLFENSASGIAIYEIIWDEHGEIVDWVLVNTNPSGARHLPVPIEQAIGKRATELFGLENMKEYFQVCREVVDRGRGRQFETFFVPSGAYHLAWVYAIGKSYYVTGSVDITERKRMEIELHEALTELESMRERLELENVYLRNLALAESGHATIIGDSEPVRKMLGLARKVAPTDSPVLITGETGTGKELLAQAIHDLSKRSKRVMIKVNCATLPALLIESELCGREKGAYTGALTREIGRFELAHGSTIFLDEIGELPLEVQGKLLRVLQEGQFERLGSPHSRTVDVRVIAATNRNLAAMVQEGRFRADLYYRLNVFPIEAPKLRERREDIPLLAWRFVNEFSQKMGKTIDSIPRRSMELLQQYPWPGNIRELRNVVERAMILSGSPTLKIEIPLSDLPEASPPGTLAELERQQILDVLNRTGWRVAGSGGAAEILGLKRTTLEARMKKWGIRRPQAK
jgi:formate hydrogenlyase transcriptional activator